jgi:hypothetical protein
MIRYLSVALALLLATSAQAQQINGKVRYLGSQPPAEYDKPYTGKLTIRRLETEEEIVATCPKANARLGCAKHPTAALAISTSQTTTF